MRPISLTSTLSKSAESIIIERGLKSDILNLIDPGQFGFLPGSSMTLALISMIHHWLRDTDATSSTVRAILLDYRKAFDLVDHNLLMYKLKDLGVKPTVINWIADFLRNRTQKVKLNNNCFSDWLDIPAGVPQGTRLGPWLCKELIFWTLFTFTVLVSDQLLNILYVLVNCFTAVYLNSYLKKFNVYRKELCELFFLVFLIQQHTQKLDFYHFIKEENF